MLSGPGRILLDKKDEISTETINKLIEGITKNELDSLVDVPLNISQNLCELLIIGLKLGWEYAFNAYGHELLEGGSGIWKPDYGIVSEYFGFVKCENQKLITKKRLDDIMNNFDIMLNVIKNENFKIRFVKAESSPSYKKDEEVNTLAYVKCLWKEKGKIEYENPFYNIIYITELGLNQPTHKKIGTLVHEFCHLVLGFKHQTSTSCTYGIEANQELAKMMLWMADVADLTLINPDSYAYVAMNAYIQSRKIEEKYETIRVTEELVNNISSTMTRRKKK